MLKVVSWNCNGKFRTKFKEIIKLNADIYVIQECEDPSHTEAAEYKEFAANSVWIGTDKNKGLGVFCKPEVTIKPLDWPAYCLRNFLPVLIDHKYVVVGVWACKPYIEEYYIYQNINIDKYDGNTIIIGDFNSNRMWDREHPHRNHSAVVDELAAKGLSSAYHYISEESQGEETSPTFYLYRHQDKGYHIDHCFCDAKKIVEYKVDGPEWLEYSDHTPIELLIK